MKQYYSLTEAAQVLGYSSGSVVRDYVYKGYIKAKKIGRNYVIDYREINRRKKVIEAYHEKQKKA